MGGLAADQFTISAVTFHARLLDLHHFLAELLKQVRPSRMPTCAIPLATFMSDSEYLPTLTLNFASGATNAYRIHANRVEFQTGDGTWRVLSAEDVQLHLVLHTEVSKWLMRYQMDSSHKIA